MTTTPLTVEVGPRDAQPRATIEVIVPIVHLNGTGRENLKDWRAMVLDALQEACGRLKEMAPNGRDYYPEPGLMEKAVAQHRRRQQTIDDLIAELEAEVEAIDRA